MPPENVPAERPRLDAAVLLLARALAALAAAAVAAMALLVVASVLTRYALGAPFRFSEELAGLLLAMAAFLAMPLTVAADLNIRVTLLPAQLPPAARRILFVFGQIVLLAFGAVFVIEAWSIAEFTLMRNLKTEQARLPLAPWIIAMVAAVALTTALAAWRALRPPPPGG
jgi:TRAP-type C4-dicarboxylate transport system permease small subunit